MMVVEALFELARRLRRVRYLVIDELLDLLIDRTFVRVKLK
jgi:hypothetical protein